MHDNWAPYNVEKSGDERYIFFWLQTRFRKRASFSITTFSVQDRPDDGFFYVGVTTRSWQKRWAERRRAIESGSPLLFHRKLREELSVGRATHIYHKVGAITDDIERLYEPARANFKSAAE